MKKLLIIFGIVTLISCGQQPEEQEKRKQIAQYKKEKNELDEKIQKLNNELGEISESGSDAYRVPVFVEEMQPDTFRHFINANGSVEAVDEAFISPETNGQIKKIYVEEGDRVKKGQALIHLKTRVLESNIKEVKTNLELARKTYEKQKRLWEDSVGSEMEYLQAKNKKESLESKLESLKAQLDMSSIEAPFNGIVEEITQKTGELASPGQPILHLVNLKKLKIQADLSEKYLQHINTGDQIRINFPALENYSKTAAISRKGSIVDEESRTFTIEARFSNRNEKIRPNQIAIINVNDFTKQEAIVIPSQIIKQDRKGDYIYITKEKNGKTTASKTYVETGRSYNNQTLINEGIEAGQKVITAGYTEVSEGSEVNIKEKKELVK
ncbi:MAG: efflux RND transporter periplasmic adaptor subunit [Bacteroidota bacterium]